jgi:predicted nucleic acid-binding protein
VIVLDASCLIAYFNSDDAHHDEAVAVLAEHADDEFLANTITLAEFLVGPVRVELHDRAVSNLASLGVAEAHLPDDAATRLARLRAEAGAPKLRDCCVMLAAQVAAESGAAASIATFDETLRSAALRHGIAVLPEANQAAST